MTCQNLYFAFPPHFRAGQVGKRPALTTQNHTLICKIFILGQTKHTVDIVDLFTQAELPKRRVLDIRPDVSDRCQDSWSSR
ncbi:hypothetical protein N7517_002126 [Penicillium concentricum]|uniref:Uncharacterized protein n=1 Tax=Penicillium concentricum TaxID=293559 RepID=A0A9W9STE4_9EURO|nr:uncharacterized protein N7517_002126 [Penicillium concentricum]KAJ5384215.1 hypothetical protein N7517_002126 [Penicillium concentricum]